MENKITKADVMQELYGIVSEKCKIPGRYYLFDELKPRTARNFYCFVYRKVECSLDSILDGHADSWEYIKQYKQPHQIAEALVVDIEHQYIERRIVAES